MVITCLISEVFICVIIFLVFFMIWSCWLYLQVCRQFFLKTLDVSEKASRIVLEKMVRGELGSEGGTGTPPPGSVRPQSSQEDRLSIKNEDLSHQSNEEDDKSDDSSWVLVMVNCTIYLECFLIMEIKATWPYNSGSVWIFW